MIKVRYARSIAKYLRRQKSVIRRNTENKEEQNKLIEELIARVNESLGIK